MIGIGLRYVKATRYLSWKPILQFVIPVLGASTGEICCRIVLGIILNISQLCWLLSAPASGMFGAARKSKVN